MYSAQGKIGPKLITETRLFSLRRKDALNKADITHIVSALRLPLDNDLFVNFKHHVVEVDDADDENIIEHFANSNAFIQEGIDGGGGVLVHWWVQGFLWSFFASFVFPCGKKRNYCRITVNCFAVASILICWVSAFPMLRKWHSPISVFRITSSSTSHHLAIVISTILHIPKSDAAKGFWGALYIYQVSVNTGSRMLTALESGTLLLSPHGFYSVCAQTA